MQKLSKFPFQTVLNTYLEKGLLLPIVRGEVFHWGYTSILNIFSIKYGKGNPSFPLAEESPQRHNTGSYGTVLLADSMAVQTMPTYLGAVCELGQGAWSACSFIHWYPLSTPHMVSGTSPTLLNKQIKCLGLLNKVQCVLQMESLAVMLLPQLRFYFYIYIDR